jgi:hypothetical protein
LAFPQFPILALAHNTTDTDWLLVIAAPKSVALLAMPNPVLQVVVVLVAKHGIFAERIGASGAQHKQGG